MLLEKDIRLSSSMIWKLQAAYYDKVGPDAWKNGIVPSKITTNTFIARSYARLIFRFLLDCQQQGTAGPLPKDRSQPVLIVELGAGHGRFGYYCVKQLLELQRNSPVSPPCFRYVMTDLARPNIEHWQANEYLKPLVAAGVLDFARFSAVDSESLELLDSGERITPKSPRGPMIVIANYFFDSLPQDIYRVESGRLQQSLVSVSTSASEEPDLLDPAVIDRLQLEYSHQEAAPDLYPQPELNRILHEYREKLGDTAFCFPIGAFQCLENLQRLAGDQILLISADKGYNHAWQLLGKVPPNLVRHGSFSFSVNYHAIGRYFRQRGGIALHSSARNGNLELSAFIARGTPQQFPQACLAFHEHFESFGPVDYFVLKTDLAKREPAPSLEQCLKLIRLGAWDPDTLFELETPIREQVEAAAEEVQNETVRCINKVHENFFPLESYRDLPFSIGRILQRLGRYHLAIGHYERSLTLFGVDRSTYNNLGMCYYRLDALSQALAFFEKALATDPSYGNAREWRLRVLAELQNGATSGKS